MNSELSARTEIKHMTVRARLSNVKNHVLQIRYGVGILGARITAEQMVSLRAVPVILVGATIAANIV
ncbi:MULTISPECIES: hypothetical protein [Brucella/Ochrobactrum group]|uniref:hypothetical protein n=1 Tax=Brucella/Ochrobactrum group TaxID=2826938 RepID=UPI001C04A8CA|nr:hypothetical protein [Brucella sp. NBRC 12950]QWK80679.1 hypothetical protein KMS41_23510 [Ochrobactrum sp. BTU1]GLU28078.1 hypothetical protein Brsp01_33110 [Brucella sp. NBRC 12950]